MIRVQVSASVLGTSPFTFGINPDEYDASDSAPIDNLIVIHGGKIYQNVIYDGRSDHRPRKMFWHGTPVTNTKIDAIITYFKALIGQIRYFNFNDINSINSRWPSSATWKKTRIVNLEVQHLSGGSLVYDTVILTIQPEF